MTDKAQMKPAGQEQDRQPGIQAEMDPAPEIVRTGYIPSQKLKGKVALVTGGDSGIGQSAVLHFAKEGADIAFVYLNEHDDANKTKKLVEDEGRKCIAISGDLGQESFCSKVIDETIRTFGRIDVLVNNAAEQHPKESLEDITADQLERTFRTNIFAYFFITRAALKYLKPGSVIINTTSVTAYQGSAHLIDYAATKGAIVAFTRSLSESLVKKGIRVNGVAPGPIWTPLIPSTFGKDQVAHFGEKYPMGRPGQPSEVGPCYVFLASDDSTFMSGQVLHPNGGKIVNA